jgi:hypothetical protein
MSAVINPPIPTLGRRIHVKKLSEDGEETDESYWLWLEFPETIKVCCFSPSTFTHVSQAVSLGSSK